MKENQPKNWPERWIYSSESVGKDINIELLRLILCSSRPEDKNKTIPCIEEKKIHPDLELREITAHLVYKGPQPHPLAHQLTFDGHQHRGVFAKKKIPKDTVIGEFTGEITVLTFESAKEKDVPFNLLFAWKTEYLICIDCRKIANEMMYMNEYLGLQEMPNIVYKWMIHRGNYYCCCVTSRNVEPDEELVSDYGPIIKSF